MQLGIVVDNSVKTSTQHVEVMKKKCISKRKEIKSNFHQSGHATSESKGKTNQNNPGAATTLCYKLL